MAVDNFKPKGQAKNYKNDSGGGVVRNSPIIGVVKNNIDPNHSGRIDVYIADFGARDPNDSKNWTTVGYMSPFFGSTRPSAPNGEKDYGSYSQNPSSYGMWFSPPDIGSKVVCVFINGDVNYGYYIGSVMDAELLQMVPAIGTNTKNSSVIFNGGEAKSYGGATQLPVTNLNTNNPKITNSAGFLNAPKPVHSYSASIYFQQGLLRDPVRGPVSSSALRESPSRVGWGVSTPGRPIYQGGYTDETIAKQKGSENTDSLKVVARRSGHTMVMDDGDVTGKDQFIRLRTSLGHQILMSDDGQTLFIIHSNGQSYIELGKEGTIDMYSTNSVNIRTQGDLNLHADNNININAKKDLNIAADNIKVNATKNYDLRVGANYSGYTMGKYTVKVNGAMSMGAGGEGSYASGGTMYINGSIINLNTGSTSNPPAEVPLIPQVAHTDTLGDKTKGYAAAPGLLLSIVSRAPAHAPWANAGQGVDVKVSTSASASLPASPSPATTAANKASSTTAAPNPVSTSTLSTVPATGSASDALTPATTSGLVGAAASQAAGTASEAVNTGTSVVTDATGQVNAAVGQFAMTPQQIEAAVLKPGAADLVTGLVQNGSNVTAAMTQNLFKGTPGAENLAAFTNNLTAQVGAKVTNLQQAQTALTNVGAMTGGEAAGSVAGIISAAASVGTGAATDFIKNASGGAANALGDATKLASSVGDAVSGAMAAGSLATDLTTNVTGGLNSIANGVEGMMGNIADGAASLMDKAKGIAGSAFSAITGSFKDFTPGVPQNLAAIAEKNAAAAAAGASGLGDLADAAKGVTDLTGSVTSGGSSLLDNVGSAVAGAAGSALDAVTGAAGKVGDVITGAAGLINGDAAKIAGGVSNLVSKAANITGIASGAASLASGVSNLAGGENAISSITNAVSTVSNIIPGVSGIGDMAKTLSTAAQNGINPGAALDSTITSLTAGAGNAASDLLNKVGGGAGALAGALAAGKDKLSDLASAGLPPGLGSKLAASINSLNTAGGDPIKMPSVGLGTLDRSELTASIGSVLGDKKIEMPNFSGSVSTAATAQADKLSSILTQVEALRSKQDEQYATYVTARDALYSAIDNLPEGDPAIATAKAAASAEYTKLTAISTQISDLVKSA
jgi:hypothetical protein